MKELSVKFYQKYDGKKGNTENQQFREALMYLFLSQTSCFRYWGEGVWTEYAKELCRRGLELV